MGNADHIIVIDLEDDARPVAVRVPRPANDDGVKCAGCEEYEEICGGRCLAAARRAAGRR